MNLRITAPQHFTPCTISLPLSKSVMNRLLMLHPELPLPDNSCEDLIVMKKAVETISSHTSQTLHLKASGTAMRFITALCAVTDGEWMLVGDTRLYERPIHALVDALRSVGADIDYVEKIGFLPLKIRGNSQLRGGDITIDAHESSQFVSALMLVAHRFQDGLNIHHNATTSLPYIRLTEEILRHPNYPAEADWSASSFWFEMSWISGMKISLDATEQNAIRLDGLSLNSLQGDKAIMTLCAETTTSPIDFSNHPDLVLPVIVTHCMKGLPFRFTGVKNLKIKESNRLICLKRELEKMNIKIDVGNDTVCYDATTTATHTHGCPPIIDTHNDHRIAMALAPCALKTGTLIMNDAHVVRKSYPTFWDDLRRVGFQIKEL